MFDFKISILNFVFPWFLDARNPFHALYSYKIYIYFFNVNIRIMYLNILYEKDILKLIYI